MSAAQRDGAHDVIGAGADADEPSWGSGRPVGGRRWLPLGLAFVLGVVVGAAGWDRWRDFAEDRARESAFAVAAEFGTVFGPAANQGELNEGELMVSIMVRLRNTGPLPVEIVEVDLDVPGLAPLPGVRPATLTLLPDRTEIVRFARILRCEELAVTGDEPLVVRARTADGRLREKQLELGADMQRIGDFARSQCERPS
jgi:hypothetical protein